MVEQDAVFVRELPPRTFYRVAFAFSFGSSTSDAFKFNNLEQLVMSAPFVVNKHRPAPP